jgi:hypothetical protein
MHIISAFNFLIIIKAKSGAATEGYLRNPFAILTAPGAQDLYWIDLAKELTQLSTARESENSPHHSTRSKVGKAAVRLILMLSRVDFLESR